MEEIWKRKPEHLPCPLCRRPFRSIMDYPRVRLVAFEELPIPEVVDTFSGAAVMRQQEVRKKTGSWERSARAGILLTPQISRAVRTATVRKYFALLRKRVGQVVDPGQLKPYFAPDPYFKFTHPIPKTELYLELKESDNYLESRRRTDIIVLSPGPSLGMAGGRTLQPHEPIAFLIYEGILESL